LRYNQVVDVKKLIKEYLEKARLMQVVTAKNNQPWACSVYFAYDEKFNLYWISTPQRRHSQEIQENEKVAGVIVLPHTPGDKVRGIQLQGTAKQLTIPEEMQHGMDVYGSRMSMNEERKQKIIQGKDNHVPYQIIPTLIVLFDEVSFPDNPRQELHL
jgi:uncharacterized protein YhbP (UPF0306 family)